MAEGTLPKTYKYQIQSEEFAKIFLADDYEFEELRKNGKVPAGIMRLSIGEIFNQNDLGDCFIKEKHSVTFLHEVEVTDITEIKDRNTNCASLFCYRSKLDFFYIYNSKLTDSENKGGSFYFYESSAKNFTIDHHCTVGNFIIDRNSNLGSIRIDDNCTADYFTISGQSVTESFVIYKNCRTGDFNITDSKTGFFRIEKNSTTKGFTIYNSTTGDFKISNQSKAANFRIDNNSNVQGINISDESSAETFFIEMSTVGSVFIFNKSTVEDIFLKKCTTNILTIEANCTIQNISIDTDCSIGDFRIGNSSRTGNLSIGNNSALTELSIYDQSIIGYLNVYSSILKRANINSSTTKDITINKSNVENLSIVVKSTTGNITIENSTMEKFIAEGLSCSFSIAASGIALMQLTNCSIKKLTISLACKMEAYISEGVIVLIDFRKTTLGRETILSFSQVKIYALLMEEFVMNGSLYFREISAFGYINTWNVRDAGKRRKMESAFRKTVTKGWKEKNEQMVKDLTLTEKISEPTIRISQSSLGKTEFSDCMLASFKFEYNNSKITECFITGGTVPEKNIHIPPVDAESLEWHAQKASIYNQLKKIFEAQGDLYQATKFQAKWAQHQQKYLQKKRADEFRDAAPKTLMMHRRLQVYFNETSQDIYTLFLNKISNNHGESWFRALSWLLGIGLFFYLCYLGSIGRLNNHSFDPNLVGYYFEYLNPVHKINFVDEKLRPGGLTVFIDFTGRLFIAYFIYQFIAAFRKNSKR